jgi:hypothetical protein
MNRWLFMFDTKSGGMRKTGLDWQGRFGRKSECLHGKDYGGSTLD